MVVSALRHMAKQRIARPPLSLPDFERVFRTIHGVLLNEQGNPSRACLYFGVFGAAILSKHHRLSALPVVGAAAYNLGTTSNDVLAFATTQTTGLRSSESAFHCWLEVDGWAIDFSAPLFKEMLPSSGAPRQCARQMLQKPLQGMAPSFGELSSQGSYWYEPNPELATRLFQRLADKPANKDLLDICVNWYRPSPRKMLESIGVGDQHGRVKAVRLSPFTLQGAW